MNYRARDLLLPPGLLSLARIPLAVCFPFLVGSPPAALAILLLAGLTDVLDGWVARRYGMVTATGTALDPVTDKIFVLTVVVTLVASGQLAVSAVLQLSTRELAELPLVIYFAVSPRAHGSGTPHPSANAAGKLVTILQFATVSWALLRGPGLDLGIAATALAGTLAALSYWRRALSTASKAEVARPGERGGPGSHAGPRPRRHPCGLPLCRGPLPASPQTPGRVARCPPWARNRRTALLRRDTR